MKEYEYAEEKFELEDTGQCQISVTDGLNTVFVSPNESDASVYKVSTVNGGWSWHTNSVKESVDRACRVLIDHSRSTSKETACKELREFVDDL